MSTRASAVEWRAVVGYEGLYEVSNTGLVRSLDRKVEDRRSVRSYKGRLRIQVVSQSGHHTVQLSKDAQPLTRFVHRMVLEAFVGPCPDGMEGCHNDGNPGNNHVSNLRWDTRSSNMLDKTRHGRDPHANMTHCKWGHPFDDNNTFNRNGDKGHRGCRACRRNQWRRWVEKKRKEEVS
jgi:hypothetical protein